MQNNMLMWTPTAMKTTLAAALFLLGTVPAGRRSRPRRLSRPIERHFMSTRRALMNYRPELVGWKAFPCGSDTSFHFQLSSDREPWNTAPLW
jgi:hypothetical protein